MKLKLLLFFIFLTGVSLSQNDVHSIVDSLIMLSEFDQAEQIAKEGLKQNPNDSRTKCALACVYRNRAYKSGIQFDPTSYIKDGEDGVIELNGDNFETMFQEQFYFDDSIFRYAEEIYMDIIENDKHFYDAYFNLLNSYEENDNYEKYFNIIDLFVINFQDQKDTEHYLLDLVNKLNAKERFEESIKLYKIIIENYPTFSDAISDLGAIYFNQGNIEDATYQFESAYKLNHNDTLIIGNLVNAYIILNEFEKAYNYSIELIDQSTSYFNYFTGGSLAVFLEKENKMELLNTFSVERKKELNEDQMEEDFWYIVSDKLSNMDKFKKEDIEFLEEVTHTFYNSGYHFDVLVFGNLILKHDSDNGLAYMAVTSTYERLNYTKKVLALLHEIESKNEKEKIIAKEDLIFNFARNYFMAEEYEKSIEYLEKIKNKKYTIFKNYLFGECYYYLENEEESIKYHSLNSELDDQENMYYINMSIRRLKELQ